ncbi:FMN-binding negative transcriptional regulator [Gluconobacter sp. Dm-62]|uniref:FMN-binding negative transcriptional regulator n=1 Tax=Gluconobacter sp. Dm-62 TaxID=2799804 RepID=UPI001B8D84F1|nr:FMN-binding negative transcriptional regulator [Gluconobacter sp. Dm-62]MBS1104043.1 FMN-binding negative transcriptional regulator [Gluconobacter sp. Dm-62]
MFNPALQLVRDYPLAAITGISIYPGLPVHIPLIAQTEGEPEQITSFIGHMAKRNVSPQALQSPQEVGILFCGPEGYITPNLLTDRSWIPTWNYARLFVSGQITFYPEITQSSLEILTQEMEQNQPAPWSMEEAGNRIERLKEHIIGFRVENLTFHPAFKLGQDEKEEIFSQIIENHNDRLLTIWMEKFRDLSI